MRVKFRVACFRMQRETNIVARRSALRFKFAFCPPSVGPDFATYIVSFHAPASDVSCGTLHAGISAQAHAVRNECNEFRRRKASVLRAGQVGRLRVESACFRRLSFSVESVAARTARAKIFSPRFQIFRVFSDRVCFALFARRNGKIATPRARIVSNREGSSVARIHDESSSHRMPHPQLKRTNSRIANRFFIRVVHGTKSWPL